VRVLPRSPSKVFFSIDVGISGVAVATAAGAIVAWIAGAEPGPSFTSGMLAFALFIALADLIQIPLDRAGGFSLGLAPALGFALLRTCADAVGDGSCESLVTPHLGAVLAVFLAGSAGAMLVRLMRRERPSLAQAAARLLVIAAAGAAYRGVLEILPSRFTFGPAAMSSMGLAVVVVVVFALDTAFQSILRVAEEQLPWRQVARDHMRATGALIISTLSVGVLLALAYPTLRAWTLPLLIGPLAATQYSFKQMATIRTNYLETVRALSKVPEMAGYTVAGHSGRVAELAVEIAKELGIGDPELHEIEYAALLHDIGRVSLPDPEEASKTVSSLELALVGAEIVAKTGHMPNVATMVRQQNEPYRRRGEDANRQLMTGAKIVKVASAFDDLTEPGGPSRTPWDALEKLHLGMAYDYDPQVIQALSRVLEKRNLV
jgi:putative nucleotidyltransferase with HDIG domain